MYRVESIHIICLFENSFFVKTARCIEYMLSNIYNRAEENKKSLYYCFQCFLNLMNNTSKMKRDENNL